MVLINQKLYILKSISRII